MDLRINILNTRENAEFSVLFTKTCSWNFHQLHQSSKKSKNVEIRLISLNSGCLTLLTLFIHTF